MLFFRLSQMIGDLKQELTGTTPPTRAQVGRIDTNLGLPTTVPTESIPRMRREWIAALVRSRR